MRVRIVALVVLVALSGCFGPVRPGAPGGVDVPADSPAAGESGESPQSLAEQVRTALDRLGPGGLDSPPRIVARGFSPSYDPAAVLDRVERLRGLNATGSIVVHQYDYRPGPEVNLANRYAGIRPAGSAALALASNQSVPAPQPLGYTVETDDGVHVWLLSPDGSAARNTSQEAVLAHELTHALQFQHDVLSMTWAGLHAEFDDWTTDAHLTARAIVEGDATAVMLSYERRYLSDSRPVKPDDAVGQRRAWVQSFKLAQYYHGSRYYAALDATPDERTRVIEEPPNSTTELLHPDETRKGVPEVTVPPTVGDEAYERTATDTVGELVIRRTLRLNGVESERAAAAASGWENGIMGYYSGDGNATTVRWETVWQNSTEAREFVSAWRAMLYERNATTRNGLTRLPATGSTPGQFYTIQQMDATVAVTASTNATTVRELARALQESSS